MLAYLHFVVEIWLFGLVCEAAGDQTCGRCLSLGMFSVRHGGAWDGVLAGVWGRLSEVACGRVWMWDGCWQYCVTSLSTISSQNRWDFLLRKECTQPSSSKALARACLSEGKEMNCGLAEDLISLR